MKSPTAATQLVANPMIRDRRVEQTAKVLATVFGATTVLALDASGRLPKERAVTDDVTVIRFGALRSKTSGDTTEAAATAQSYRSGRSSRGAARYLRALLPLVIIGRSLLYSIRAVAAIRDSPPQLVWANDLPTLPAAVFAGKRAKVPIVYDSHEVYTERVTSRPLDQFWRAIERRFERLLIHRVDLVITVSDGAAEAIERIHDLDERPSVIRSIPALDAPSDAPTLDRSLRADLGVSADESVVVYTGVIAPARAVDLAIKGLSAMNDHSVHLAVVGYGERSHLADLQQLAVARGVESNVHFLDPVPSSSVVDYIAEADVAVIPGRPVSLNSEIALPNKLFEALLARLPLVVNDKPEITRFVEANSIGLVCDCEDANAFAEALHTVLAGPKDWASAIEAACATNSWVEEAKLLADHVKRVGAFAAATRT